jgi:D-alanyl-D-alanine carboxypeptidase
MPKGAADDWTPERIIEFALANGAQIAPGEAFIYSNPGYVLAGEIVASERGEPLSLWLRREVFEPCGMAETWSGGDEEFPRARLARQYVFDSAHPDAPPEDSSDWYPLSGIGAAGDLVTTPRDLARGVHALFTGHVLSPAALADLTGPLLPAGFPGTNITHCGHGVLVSRFDDLTVVGHLGQLRGHVTMAGHHEASGITAVLCQNSCSSDLEAFGAAGIHPAYAEIFRLAGA